MNLRYAAALFVLLLLAAAERNSAGSLPRISDSEFWRMVVSFSEPDGRFPANNFISNEDAYPQVIPDLARAPAGGVYIGVGPEQNFTYLWALNSPLAFIIDIRRQNMLEHLLYKALFELSADRADFLSRLFSRRRPGGLSKHTSVQELMSVFERQPPDPDLFQGNFRAVLQRLEGQHRFPLSEADREGIRRIYEAFLRAGPLMNYATFDGEVQGPENSSTYSGLMTAMDSQGRPRSFLATEASFAFVRSLEIQNRIVPVIGDIAGPRSLRSIAEYLKANRAIVSAFYVSNIEVYLAGSGTVGAFYANLDALPSTPGSILIRSRSYSSRGYEWTMSACPIADVVRASHAGIDAALDAAVCK